MTRKEFSFNDMNRARVPVRAAFFAMEIFLRDDIVDMKLGTVLARVCPSGHRHFLAGKTSTPSAAFGSVPSAVLCFCAG